MFIEAEIDNQGEKPSEDNDKLFISHQRCESGSTGFCYPEPANSDSNGLPRPYQSNQNRLETQAEVQPPKPKKKVQFRNVVTEPDVYEFRQTNTEVECEEGNDNESHEISREDTMVEHSVVVNEESKEGEPDCDYMAALQCMQLDQGVFSKEPAQTSGECEVKSDSGIDELELRKDGVLVT